MNKNLSNPAQNSRRPMKLIVSIILGVVAFSALIGFAVANSGASNSSGVAAPSQPVSVAGLRLPAVSGNQVALNDYLGQKPVLLYFSMGVG